MNAISATDAGPDRGIDSLLGTALGIVRNPSIPDLTLRQISVLLRVYTSRIPQTVKALSADLGVPKPAISRALDRLTACGLVARRHDPCDRRIVYASRTQNGGDFVRSLSSIVASAGEAL
ncbi:MarR family transcriptional regulator [Falsiroseomonas sp. CW058]|uniref:MarR family transcriptional regulator n=1 Tax=Falsiroseomonas sp. CW058 TaxID=3388664 RepID=UPI003D32463F